MDAPTDEAELRTAITLARLEAKIDIAIGQTQARLDEMTRRQNENDRRTDDQEARLRVVEQRPTVTPKAMWAAIGLAVAAAGAAAPYLLR